MSPATSVPFTSMTSSTPFRVHWKQREVLSYAFGYLWLLSGPRQRERTTPLGHFIATLPHRPTLAHCRLSLRLSHHQEKRKPAGVQRQEMASPAREANAEQEHTRPH